MLDALADTDRWAEPAEEELAGTDLDPDSCPPGDDPAWLASLPGVLREEYFAATRPAGPEPIPAGRLGRHLGGGGGFAAGGVADQLPPGQGLAGFAAHAWDDGLGKLTDDELIGVMGAARRLSSWSAALELATVAELARRREAQAAATGDAHLAEHTDTEIAAALTLTGRAASSLLDLAISLDRLPVTMGALAAGQIDRHRAAVIAGETCGLDYQHATGVEQAVLGDAPTQTTGQLRAATRRAVLAADPAAARRRRQAAARQARVEKWDVHSGTAALAGRDLPPAGVLAADQNLTALARQLKTAGVAGTAGLVDVLLPRGAFAPAGTFSADRAHLAGAECFQEGTCLVCLGYPGVDVAAAMVYVWGAATFRRGAAFCFPVSHHCLPVGAAASGAGRPAPGSMAGRRR